MKVKNNNLIKILVAILVLIPFSSCSDWLDITPSGKVVVTEYWKNESDVEAMLMTCYRSMVEDDYVKQLILFGELRSDNLSLRATTDESILDIYNVNLLPTNGYSRWDRFYDVINFCNTVLYYAPQVKDANFSTKKLQAKMAEALTLRALNYFYLVRVFGEVPYVTDASVSDLQDYEVPKSSENVILDNLEKDLLQAEDWALISYGSEVLNKGRVTKNAIRALLADIYLWRSKYNECITYSDKIINDTDNPLLLVEPEEQPYRSIFYEKNSSESIFELQFSASNTTLNKAISDYYGDGLFPGIFVAPKYLCEDPNVFTNIPKLTDTRRKDYITEVKSTDNLYFIKKYVAASRMEYTSGTNVVSLYSYRNSSTWPANWIIYRLSDIMLMKAEALTQKGELSPALKIVNTTYMRSNPSLNPTDTLKLTDYSTKKSMEELVLLERQRELIFEGKRWFDLMRIARRDGNTNRLIDKVLTKFADGGGEASSKLIDMNGLYFPINKYELDANTKLIQNPFYTSTGK